MGESQSNSFIRSLKACVNLETQETVLWLADEIVEHLRSCSTTQFVLGSDCDVGFVREIAQRFEGREIGVVAVNVPESLAASVGTEELPEWIDLQTRIESPASMVPHLARLRIVVDDSNGSWNDFDWFGTLTWNNFVTPLTTVAFEVLRVEPDSSMFDWVVCSFSAKANVEIYPATKSIAASMLQRGLQEFVK